MPYLQIFNMAKRSFNPIHKNKSLTKFLNLQYGAMSMANMFFQEAQNFYRKVKLFI